MFAKIKTWWKGRRAERRSTRTFVRFLEQAWGANTVDDGSWIDEVRRGWHHGDSAGPHDVKTPTKDDLAEIAPHDEQPPPPERGHGKRRHAARRETPDDPTSVREFSWLAASVADMVPPPFAAMAMRDLLQRRAAERQLGRP
jgi:hypothetical protein